jgi:hypothetical protein
MKMRRVITEVLLGVVMLGCGVRAVAQQASFNGLFYAAEFGKWTMPAGQGGAFSWSGSGVCSVSAGGLQIKPFVVGTPVKIMDANPAYNEVVTPSQVNYSGIGCSVTFTPAPQYTHHSYNIVSATAGLQEAINYAQQYSANGNYPQSVIVLTPAWTALGGTTAMITSASGSTNVSIQDQRSGQLAAFLWSVNAYAVAPLSHVGGFSDNGALSAWPATAHIPVNQFSAIRSISITTQSPWSGCSTPAMVNLVDNTGASVIAGVTASTYSKGTISVDKVIVGSNISWIAVQFTSASGCAAFATGIQATVNLDSIVVTVTPTSATVPNGTTATFDQNTFYGSDASLTNISYTLSGTGVTWSVDGVAGGNSTVGTITNITDANTGQPAGLYTAPTTTGTHTITATSNGGSGAYANATVTVI